MFPREILHTYNTINDVTSKVFCKAFEVHFK